MENFSGRASSIIRACERLLQLAKTSVLIYGHESSIVAKIAFERLERWWAFTDELKRLQIIHLKEMYQYFQPNDRCSEGWCTLYLTHRRTEKIKKHPVPQYLIGIAEKKSSILLFICTARGVISTRTNTPAWKWKLARGHAGTTCQIPYRREHYAEYRLSWW